MARSFNMATLVKVGDIAVARAALAAEKNPSYHHALMLKRVTEVGEITAQDLYDFMQMEVSYGKTPMSPAQVATWDKYSASCHLSYFINRCRGAVTAEVNGVAVAQTPTKVKKAEVKEEAAPVETPAEEAPAEEPVSEEEAETNEVVDEIAALAE